MTLESAVAALMFILTLHTWEELLVSYSYSYCGKRHSDDHPVPSRTGGMIVRRPSLSLPRHTPKSVSTLLCCVQIVCCRSPWIPVLQGCGPLQRGGNLRSPHNMCICTSRCFHENGFCAIEQMVWSSVALLLLLNTFLKCAVCRCKQRPYRCVQGEEEKSLYYFINFVFLRNILENIK